MNRCGSKTEVYSRVVGYYRPVEQWNKGKKEEFYDRREYDQDTATAKLKDTEEPTDGQDGHGQGQADPEATIHPLEAAVGG